MNKGSRQRLREAAKQQEARFARRRNVLRLFLFIAVGTIAVGTLVWIHSRQQEPDAVFKAESMSLKQPETFHELLALLPVELQQCDIARMNLLCAERLPGAEDLKVDETLVTLDNWAQHIKSETDRNFHHFQEDPAYYYNSEAFYKMLMMAVVVYEDFGVRYDPKWIAKPSEIQGNDHFFANSRDIFIHGLLGPARIGTCSSMPILYIALGRRLGYPLKLVTTKEHLFMRWESSTERFDMDATAKGLNKYDDEYYRQFPFPITEKEIKENGYLESLSPQEELSVFLSIRGACLTEAGRLAEATESFNVAHQLAPRWKGNQVLLAAAQHGSLANDSLGSRQSAASAIPQPSTINVGVPNILADPNPLKQMQNQTPLP